MQPRIVPGSPFPREPKPMPQPTGRLRRPTLLIVGCGDVGLRVLPLVLPRWRVLALSSSPERLPLLRAHGAVPLWGNLDEPATLGRLAGLADAVLHLAPPPGQGDDDPRTAALLAALARGTRVRRLVYASTTGVYGDRQGERIDETAATAATTARARRRVAAEARVRHYGRITGAQVSVLRIPGIYAPDREGGDPRERVRRGTPALVPEHDVFTNHIHADDLARACVAALHRGRPQRVVNVCDDTELRMGDYLDLVAAIAGLPPVPRLTREEAARQLSPMTMSFMGESRRIGNARLKQELRLRLRHPTVAEGLRPAAAGSAPA
jgi:nucleoside-diphosphate-sugar epimerase